jgi:flagellar biosynthesis/type III secretory pathway M-ring protein FliF/YscJ
MKKLIIKILSPLLAISILFSLIGCAKDKTKFTFEKINEQHISNIEKILNENKIDYEITDNKETIVMDRSKKEVVFNLLAKKGITGLEDIPKSNTENSEISVAVPSDINKDFSKIFEQMNGIKKANVIIQLTQPQQAIVDLALEPNYNYTNKDSSIIKGIIFSSIPVISERNFTLTAK